MSCICSGVRAVSQVSFLSKQLASSTLSQLRLFLLLVDARFDLIILGLLTMCISKADSLVSAVWVILTVLITSALVPVFLLFCLSQFSLPLNVF